MNKYMRPGGRRFLTAQDEVRLAESEEAARRARRIMGAHSPVFEPPPAEPFTFFKLEVVRRKETTPNGEKVKTYVTVKNTCVVRAFGENYDAPPEGEVEIFEATNIYLQFGYLGAQSPFEYVTCGKDEHIEYTTLHPRVFIGLADVNGEVYQYIFNGEVLLHERNPYPFLAIPVMVDGVPGIKVFAADTDLSHCPELIFPESDFAADKMDQVTAVAEYSQEEGYSVKWVRYNDGHRPPGPCSGGGFLGKEFKRDPPRFRPQFVCPL